MPQAARPYAINRPGIASQRPMAEPAGNVSLHGRTFAADLPGRADCSATDHAILPVGNDRPPCPRKHWS